jgi:ComF family protein
MVNEAGEPCCSLCRQTTPSFAKAAAYGSYDGGLRDLIHLLKYQGVKPAASVLGRMLGEAIQLLAPKFEQPVIVPVPLHPSKLRERGFNQSEMIARAALKLKPAGLDLAIRADVLERRRPTASQTGLTRHQRQENMRAAFVMGRPQEVAGREVLLVDDVFTTGTTASECARVLRRAGATRVWVATVARTMKTEVTHAVHGEETDEVPQSMAAHG